MRLAVSTSVSVEAILVSRWILVVIGSVRRAGNAAGVDQMLNSCALQIGVEVQIPACHLRGIGYDAVVPSTWSAANLFQKGSSRLRPQVSIVSWS